MFLNTNVFPFLFLRFAIGVMEWRENAVLRKKKWEDRCWIIILLRSVLILIYGRVEVKKNKKKLADSPVLWCWLYILSSSSDLYGCIHHSSSSYFDSAGDIFTLLQLCDFLLFWLLSTSGQTEKDTHTKRAQVVMYEDERWQAHQ
jgi:hypothetical protein